MLTLLRQFGLPFGPLRTERKEEFKISGNHNESLLHVCIIMLLSASAVFLRVLRALVRTTCTADLHVDDRMHCFEGYQPHVYTDTTATLFSQVVSNGSNKCDARSIASRIRTIAML